ncbi:hypothetical protein NL676_008401 [Syzygium grande]|nr:hypothetical protein NL676_008401 [Syzygium grande]
MGRIIRERDDALAEGFARRTRAARPPRSDNSARASPGAPEARPLGQARGRASPGVGRASPDSPEPGGRRRRP